MRNICAVTAFVGFTMVACAGPLAITKTHKFATVLDGVVRVNGVDRGVVNARAGLNIDKPVLIKMKMRRLAVSEVAPDRHFGVELYGGDDFKAHFYTRGAGFIAALHQGKSRISDKGIRGEKELFPAGLGAQWVDLELYVQTKLTEIHVAGKPQGVVNANLLPLKELNIYGYHTDVEIRDLASEPLPEAEEISTDPSPSFRASFDQGLDGMTAQGALIPTRALKVELVPGVSGQAVRISARGSAKTPVSAHRSWKPVNGTLESRGSNKGPLSLAVPELNEATVRLKVKRLLVPTTEQHFGMGLSGEDCGISFYTRGPDLLYQLKANKKTLAHKALGPVNLADGGEESPWHQLELKLSNGNIEVLVNSKSVGTVTHPFPPITTVSYYNYRLDTAIDDLEVKSDTFSFREDFSTFVNALDPPTLEYAAEGLFANHGTVMFWMKSDWDGHFTGNIPTYPMVVGFDAEGKQKLKIFMYHWISFTLGRTGSLRGEEMQRKSRGSWYRGDWHHIAMVWSDGGWCKAYFNGLPYQQPFGYNGKVLANLDLKSITRFTVGTGTRTAEGAFDELRIYKRPLANGEIYDEYRKFMPVDLLVDRTVIAAGKDDEVVLSAAPGGAYMRPMPAPRPLMTGKVNINVQLVNEDEDVVAEKSFSPDLAAPTELKLPVHSLPAGKYRLKCTIGKLQRTFEILAYQPLAAMPPSNDEIELGDVIFAKDITDGKILEAGGVKIVKSPIGRYLEAGARKEHRFAFEVPFPEEYLDGQPVMLEVEWPDDKPRSMGLYMYPESKHAQHRDRLGGGIQSGIEYPLTGKLQKTRYLFHPGLKSYLFEARTMIGEFPAAIANFRVYAIENKRLPRLAVNYPKDLPPRRFGHLDEDETPDQNLGWDYQDRSNAQVMTERLLDYLDYTGQNAWQYPFMRYTGYNFSMEGALHTLYPYRADAYRYMVDAMSRRGKSMIANLNLFTLPELKMLPDRTEEYVKNGWTLTKYNDPPVRPNQYTRPNHANPDVRAMVARHVKETAQRFGTLTGLDGINFCTGKIGFYPSLDYGYDDYTVDLFSRETGIAMAAKSGADRRAFLTREPQLGAWLKWRAGHSVELFRQIRTEMDGISPDLALYLTVPVTAGSAAHELGGPPLEYTTLFGELQAIKGIYLVPSRNATAHRWRLHWGKPADGFNDLLFNPAETAPFMNGKFGFVDGYHNYFESFNGSLKNDVYAGYFQNADVKPFGRYFLKELAFAVSAMDAQRILIGGQPLGTWGRDAESREFARAYCALPALPFESAPGSQDPVTVRYLNTAKGSYLYAVSMLWNDCESTLTLSSETPLQDRSTGEMIANGQLGLKPFELRSFYSVDPHVKVTAVETTTPGTVTTFYRDQLERTQKAVAKLCAEKIDCSEAEVTLARMKELLTIGQFAELHRLLFSLAISDVLDKADNFADVTEQAAMIRRGHYAVNCGATGFYKAKSGTLFFPDQPLGKSDYGHSGSYLNVVRNTDGIKTDDPELFMTEAYNVDSYRFKVPRGKYKVRLYLKVGYRKGFKPGIFVFDVAIQGKTVLENFDMFAAFNGDFHRVSIKEFTNVEASNGDLEIAFTNDENHDPTARLVNAIEVIRE